jgi:transcriptional antiterminator RfaH
VRSEPSREATAVKFLELGGYACYCPRIREQRKTHGRRYVVTPALFPNYLFVRIELQWHAARWCVGVAGIVMSGDGPARVPDAVIDGLRARERGGVVQLPEPPGLRPGDPVKVVSGLLMGATGLFAGMRGSDRVAVLLTFLGTQRAAVLPTTDVEPA